MPVTVFGDNPDDTTDVLAMLGEPPHVIKLNEGSQGTGVVLAEKRSASQSVIEAFRGLYANFLVQEFIAEAKGSDLRCFVVGKKVVAAMQRDASPGEFRANLHRGGTAVKATLSAAGKEDRGARRRRAGPGHRRRRPAALRPRPAAAGGQRLAGAGGHRGGQRGGCFRAHHQAPGTAVAGRVTAGLTPVGGRVNRILTSRPL